MQRKHTYLIICCSFICSSDKLPAPPPMPPIPMPPRTEAGIPDSDDMFEAVFFSFLFQPFSFPYITKSGRQRWDELECE